MSESDPMKGYEQEAARTAAQPILEESEIAQLVENYLPLVVHQANRVWLSPRIGLTREDLVSAGCFGLLLAARRFDPARGVAFGVFARSHVHGALMQEINAAMRAAGVGNDEVLVSGAEDIEPDSLPDERGSSAPDSAETAEVRELMEYLLTQHERLVLTLYFFEELTLAEVAAVVDGSESAVARTIKSALKKLKS
ncbi:MAG TPA: sigma-70 family RNA polymerase sigma factor, partial [Candidatus Binataceae bacterium]